MVSEFEFLTACVYSRRERKFQVKSDFKPNTVYLVRDNIIDIDHQLIADS